MTRKKSNKPKESYEDVYWQSERYNERVYTMFFNQTVELALSRFKWLNLPPTCDARFMEWTLLFQGVCTIATPARGRYHGSFFSTRAVFNGVPNVYDNPTRWRSFGANGWNFNVTSKNGTLVFDNMSRYPIISDLSILARELTDILRTKQVNRLHQKRPYVITGPQEKEFDMVNVAKQVAGNEGMVLGYDGLLKDIQFDTLDTRVPFIGKELQEDLMNTWNIIYMRLGIKNLPFKTERQIEDEVTSLTEPSDLARLSPLSCRRDALEKLKARFPEQFPQDAQVIWNTDAISENMNLLSSLTDQMKLMGGDLLAIPDSEYLE